MANKLSTVMDNLTTALDGLVEAGTVKAVERTIVVPAREHNPPVVGLVLDDFRRDDQVWVGNALLVIVAARGGGVADEVVIDLVAEVDDVIQTAIDAGNLGGIVDTPHWSNWFTSWGRDTGWSLVGARGTLRIQTVAPLKT